MIRTTTVTGLSEALFTKKVLREPTTRLGAMCGGLAQIALANGLVGENIPPALDGLSDDARELFVGLSEANVVR